MSKSDLYFSLMVISGLIASIIMIVGIMVGDNLQIVNIGAWVFGASVLFMSLALLHMIKEYVEGKPNDKN